MTGNGLCSFDLVKRAQARSSLATGDEIASAATALLNQCVHGGNGQGGIALNIGKSAMKPSAKRPTTQGLPFSRSSQDIHPDQTQAPIVT